MSRKVSSIVEQLVVLEELLCGVVRFHALRTNEALNTEAHVIISDHSFNSATLMTKKKKKRVLSFSLNYLRGLIMVKVCAGLL